MNIPTIQEIKNYYPTYLKAHKNRWNRRLHAIGNVCTVIYVASVVNYSIKFNSLILLSLLLFAPVIIYFFAWPAHRYIERNKPATWKVNPLITKACDWIMMYDMLRGRIK